MKQVAKVSFEEWKEEYKKHDLNKCFVSMNGKTEKVTVKILKK